MQHCARSAYTARRSTDDACGGGVRGATSHERVVLEKPVVMSR